MTLTRIRNARWVIAWNDAESRHEYRTDIDVVFDDAAIVWIGADYLGDVDVDIDGSDRLVMPGLINVHCHPS
ncbi:MAG: amidohydrolase family protein, partial [Acidimicrobiales bacterium]